jgi:hypothetical protein
MTSGRSLLLHHVRLEVFTAVTMKNAVFYAVTSQKTAFLLLHQITERLIKVAVIIIVR